MYDMPQYTPTGWQCPICKRVYSPMTPACFVCGNGTRTVSVDTTVQTPIRTPADWWNTISTCQTAPKTKTDE